MIARLPDHTPTQPVEMTTTGTGDGQNVSEVQHAMIVALERLSVKLVSIKFVKVGSDAGVVGALSFGGRA